MVDGTGNGWIYADVGVKGGRIVAVGDLAGEAGEREFDARGLVVAPGFIDVHTHVDDDIFANRAAANFVRDGVTTIVSGNCGSGVTEVGAFLARVEREPATVNHATLLGHNAVLRKVKGGSVKGELLAEQMAGAKRIVSEAMREGAMGFSTGLIYTPGTWSGTEEIIELMKVAADKRWGSGGIYATHMRDEGGGIMEAIDEALRVGRESGCRVQISHFKLPTMTAEKMGRGREGEAGGGGMLRAASEVTLEKVAQARRAGMEVWVDQYPYTASSTTISTLLPEWVLEKGPAEARKILSDAGRREEVHAYMRGGRGTRSGRADLSYVVIASSPGHPKWAGKNVKQIAQMVRLGEEELLGRDKLPEVTVEEQFDVVIELYVSGGASAVFHTMDEIEVKNIMKDPLVAIARDSGVRTFGAGVPHPRSYGTCTRVLGRYVRELGVIRLEEAVRKMTSMPATAFRIADRGVVRVGAWADLTVFDEMEVADQATYDRPHQYPVGIRAVFTNGVMVFDGKEMTEARPGMAVYGPGRGK